MGVFSVHDANNKIIGCIHAGWRGAFSDIIKKTINKIKKVILIIKFLHASALALVKDYEVRFNFLLGSLLINRIKIKSIL